MREGEDEDEALQWNKWSKQRLFFARIFDFSSLGAKVSGEEEEEGENRHLRRLADNYSQANQQSLIPSSSEAKKSPVAHSLRTKVSEEEKGVKRNRETVR